MTKSQFFDVLINPDSYTGVEVIMYVGFPQELQGQIFYCTSDKIYYTYEDCFGGDRYGAITKDNYLLCQFKHLQDRQKVL